MYKPSKKAMLICIAAVLTVSLGTTALAASADTAPAADEKPAVTQSNEGKGDKSTNRRGDKKAKVAGRVDVVKVAAATLGKTEDEVRESIKTGKIGDLLIAAGKVDAFKAAYLEELKVKLDAAVTAGSLTQAQADEKYASEKTKIDAYDGTTHLCGDGDHSKMFEKREKKQLDQSA